MRAFRKPRRRSLEGRPETAPSNHVSEPTQPRIRAVACLGGVSIERGIERDDLTEYLRDPGNLVWIEVQDPGPDEFTLLHEVFGFHPLALEDVAKGQQRPKVDEYRGHLFVVTYAVMSSDVRSELSTTEVDLFIGRNYVVSVHRGHVPALDDAYGRWTRGGELMREGVGFLVYTIMDAMIDAYFPLINAIEDEVDEIELEMFAEMREGAIQNLLRLKRMLVTLRRVLNPLRDIFSVLLRRERPIFSANSIVYFHDVHDHVLRILDVLDLEREMVTGALEAYLTVISNRLNTTMKALAVITVVVAIAGLSFGAWGMNFDYIPLAHRPWGFLAVVFGTMLVIGGVVAWGWRRGWLR